MLDDLEMPRVLTIQSTVVSGYVGNKVALFPLQLHGFETSAINSVQLSNHTGYQYFKGQVLGAKEIDELYEGLKLNKLNSFSFILTGYMASKSFLEKVGEAIREMKQENPNTIYLCDPVMGDNGEMYVPEELLPVYRDILVPLSDITVPNQFEAECLTGIKINNLTDSIKAIECIHKLGVQTVIMSSSTLGKGTNTLVCIASRYTESGVERYKIEFPHIDAIFVGTGDLFSATILIWLHKDKNLKTALEKTVSVIQFVIQKTIAAASKTAQGRSDSAANMELKLIQCKKELEDPKIQYFAETL
ncbi:pyridoxal kinase [Octopus bimaculoides]|uniref:Pyridoxal kinase n=1 Tax=Octopus bimaculoides TaxID=37653 RepID=A0A0L8H0T9_OCTBM|nr:pyridoxal kinase [Octopus bimaculoides]|eukprot:XP_014776361.1 PREDICTED: pyridoxal kinase-like [Octopus bimaculoides]